MVTYIDTYDNNGWSYQDYLAYCEDNSLEPGDENSDSYYKWLSMRMEDDWEDFFDNLKYSKVAAGPVSVRGCLGLWWGRPEIEPKKFNDLEGAIRACLNSADYGAKITLERGTLSVEATHHDGTNRFKIRRDGGRFFPKYLF